MHLPVHIYIQITQALAERGKDVECVMDDSNMTARNVCTVLTSPSMAAQGD